MLARPEPDYDPFDPRNWERMLAEQEAHECRIYLHQNAQVWCVVDPIDYQWALQWCWCQKKDPCGRIYARRAVGENMDGLRLRTYTVYLHIEIMRRSKRRRPSRFHYMVDHRDGNPLNNRRANLRWVTASMNARNCYSQRPVDLVEDFAAAVPS